MGTETAIAWTDHTFNPWIGCARVSPGCTNCYAEAMAHRWGHDRWGKNAERHVTSDVYWRQPLKWDRAAAEAGRPALVFCASQADVFEDRPDLVAPRQRLWDLIGATPHLIWQLLTKRPENVMGPNWWLVPPEWIEEPQDWPSNVWIGTTVEDQQRALDRIPLLLQVPAPVRFLSCEPMLEQLDLWGWFNRMCPDCHGSGSIPVAGGGTTCPRCYGPGLRQGSIALIQWVIAGGESGPGHRPLDLDGVRVLRELCQDAGVPLFVKQGSGQYAGQPTGDADLDAIKQFPAQAGPRDGTPVEVTARG